MFSPIKIVFEPPELSQFLSRVWKPVVAVQRQAAGYLNIMKQRLTLAVSSFYLKKKRKRQAIKMTYSNQTHEIFLN